MMSRDETHDALGCAVLPRELRTAARVVEVAPERRVPGSKARPNAGGERLEEHSRDAVPEERVRWFRGVVKDARDDELLVRAKEPEDPRGLGRMPVVRAAWAEEPDRLLHAVKHA